MKKCAGCGSEVAANEDFSADIDVGLHNEPDCIRRYVAMQERKRALHTHIAALVEHSNAYDEKELVAALVAEMKRSHRTLQQLFMGALKTFIEQYGAIPETHYDLRNEAAVQWSRQVASLTDSPAKVLLGGFPLI